MSLGNTEPCPVVSAAGMVVEKSDRNLGVSAQKCIETNNILILGDTIMYYVVFYIVTLSSV